MAVAQEPLEIRCAGLFTRMTLLIPAFALRFAPVALTLHLLRYPRTLPYPCLATRHRFGHWLEPRYVLGAVRLDQ
jgi:hypothetical protein